MWAVVRQDDHGNKFEVGRFADKAHAEDRLRDLTDGYPHHQHYWVEEVVRGELPTTEAP